MVAEIGLAGGEKAGNGSLQFIVDPQAAHGVVHGGIDHHGILIGIHIDNLLVHLEEVAVFLLHDVASETFDGIGEVEVDGQARGAYAVAGVAALLGGTAGHVARHQVAEGGISALEVVVALLFGYINGTQLTRTYSLGILLLLGHPDTAVVTQRLAHQREFRLVVAVHGDAGGVYLYITGVGEGGATTVADPRSTSVAIHGVGGKVVDIAVATSGHHHGMGGVAFQLTRDEVADDDTAGTAVDHHQIHHLMTLVQHHGAAGNLATQGTVGSQQQLLTRLATGVEGTAHLRTTEGAVVQKAAVVAGERHALRDTLVDDVAADLGQTVDVSLAGAIVATLDGVLEQTLHAVAIVLIVLGGVDTALGGDGVGAAR